MKMILSAILALSVIPATLSIAHAAGPATPADAAKAVMDRLGIAENANSLNYVIFKGKNAAGLDCRVVVTHEQGGMGYGPTLSLEGESYVSAHEVFPSKIYYKISKDYADKDTNTIDQLSVSDAQIVVSATEARAESIDEGRKVPANSSSSSLTISSKGADVTRFQMTEDTSYPTYSLDCAISSVERHSSSFYLVFEKGCSHRGRGPFLFAR